MSCIFWMQLMPDDFLYMPNLKMQFPSFPQLLMLQFWCFLFVGWDGKTNSSGFYMEIHFFILEYFTWSCMLWEGFESSLHMWLFRVVEHGWCIRFFKISETMQKWGIHWHQQSLLFRWAFSLFISEKKTSIGNLTYTADEIT